MKNIYLLFLVLVLPSAAAQTSNALYFPPKIGVEWATIPPDQLGFCPDRIDSLYAFLDLNNTKSFVLLKDGKIVLEKYFGNFTRDSFHYWASAGKSLTAFLVGQAQEEGLFQLTDKTSQYLGNGWTSCTPAQEDKITLWHQLTMTTGLTDLMPDPDCIDPACLLYKADAGTRWAYHNAPYRLLHDDIEKASGLTIQQFTKSHVLDKTGMKGLWFNHVQYGRARDMARFGLLMLAHGVWAGDTLLHDQDYIAKMTIPSQTYNKSYGYLWWLNGQPNFMLPTSQFVIPGELIPNAPDDLYAALGKNDQKIHVIPSKGWVIVRQGDNADATGSQVPVIFDNNMWAYINQLDCTSAVSSPATEQAQLLATPTVSSTGWQIRCSTPVAAVALFNQWGQRVHHQELTPQSGFFLNGTSLPVGVYYLMVVTEKNERLRVKLVKI